MDELELRQLIERARIKIPGSDAVLERLAAMIRQSGSRLVLSQFERMVENLPLPPAPDAAQELEELVGRLERILSQLRQSGNPPDNP